MIPLLVALVSGVVFALGLGIGGMTQPAKVVGFLDIFGNWDPSLAFVMGGAIAVHLPLSLLAGRRSKPVFGEKFALPTSKDIDVPLVVGAALFGLGWGLGGYCPGPAVAAVMSGDPRALVFAGSMAAGMLVYGLVGSVAPLPTGERVDR